MKPARGPQTEFFSNYCHGILGLATSNPGIKWAGNQQSWNQASLSKSRQVGWQPAIVESRLLAAELGKSRQVQASLGKYRGIQAIGS